MPAAETPTRPAIEAACAAVGALLYRHDIRGPAYDSAGDPTVWVRSSGLGQSLLELSYEDAAEEVCRILVEREQALHGPGPARMAVRRLTTLAEDATWAWHTALAMEPDLVRLYVAALVLGKDVGEAEEEARHYAHIHEPVRRTG